MRSGLGTLAPAAVVLVLSGCGPAGSEEQAQTPGPATAEAEAGPEQAQNPTPSRTPTPTPTEEPEPSPASQVSWDPDSIHVLVNRQNPLEPPDYSPEDLVEPAVRTSVEQPLHLRAEAGEALEELFAAAYEESISLALTSAYRSFDLQVQVYSNRHLHQGTEATDEFAARPGYSEHQTGLAADVISIDNPECITGECFHQTVEGQWVANNAHEHGFVVRYPEGMEDITGYGYEPWHLRYVGDDTSEEVFAQEVTLEEYWDQPPAPDYEETEPNPDHLVYPQ